MQYRHDMRFYLTMSADDIIDLVVSSLEGRLLR